ncbi:MAG: glycine cleavage T C-terminal barrel domain-containing protein [Pirellulales bacterium]
MNDTPSASFEQQYDALRDSGGVVELAGWSSMTLTGDDRQTFLNNFCTNDIKRLVPDTSCEAFFTNVKGKIVGHGLVSCRDDELVFIGTPNQAPRLVEQLDRYVIRENVQLRDTTAERKYVLVAGGNSVRERCEQWRRQMGPTQYNSWALVGSQFAGVVEFSTPQLTHVFGSLYEQGFALVGSQVFTAARIEAGVPLFGVDFDEQNFPQEVGRDREAISFTKGCYLGQETVARIDALGHVNQRLVGVRFFGGQLPESGMDLLQAGKRVGHVTSAAFSPKLNAPLGLAMVRREANSTGTRLGSPVGEGEVVSLPIA